MLALAPSKKDTHPVTHHMVMDPSGGDRKSKRPAGAGTTMRRQSSLNVKRVSSHRKLAVGDSSKNAAVKPHDLVDEKQGDHRPRATSKKRAPSTRNSLVDASAKSNKSSASSNSKKTPVSKPRKNKSDISGLKKKMEPLLEEEGQSEHNPRIKTNSKKGSKALTTKPALVRRHSFNCSVVSLSLSDVFANVEDDQPPTPAPETTKTSSSKGSTKKASAANRASRTKSPMKSAGKDTKGSKPALARSISLDSKLGSTDGEADTKTRPNLSQGKKNSSKRVSLLLSKTEQKCSFKRRNSKDANAITTRPTLVRSNSMDSRLSETGDPKPEVTITSPTLPESKEASSKVMPQKTSADAAKQRPSISQKKLSLRRLPSLDSKIALHSAAEKPLLVRSNSLDSKLGSMEDEQSAPKAEVRPSLSHQKKSSGRGLKSGDSEHKTSKRIPKSSRIKTKSGGPALARTISLERKHSDREGKPEAKGEQKKVKSLDSKSHHHIKENRDSGIAKIKGALPPLVRHNSLDSMLSSLDGNHQQGDKNEETTVQAKPKLSMANKEQSFRHQKSPPLDQTSTANKAIPKDEGPLLVRNNSLDSKLDSLSGESEEVDGEDTKVNDRPVFKIKTSRPSLASAKRSEKNSRKNLHKEGDSLSRSCNGPRRVGSRRSILNEPLAANGKADALDPRAIAANGHFGRRASNRNLSEGSRIRRVSCLAANGTNHALKMYIKEETFAQEQKQVTMEKVASIQKNFHNLAKEQSKFSDALLARTNCLKRVPAVKPLLSSMALGPLPNQQGMAGSPEGPGPKKTAERPADSFERAASIRFMAKRMKDLGTNFRLTKQQSFQVGEKASVARLAGEIPLLMALTPKGA